jgi:hypothetical protein
MKKTALLYGCIAVIVIGILSWISYYNHHSNVYKGMSIIPEQHQDIPLYRGLKPADGHYIVKGNEWKAIYKFYQEKLPSLGWRVQYKVSALDDNNPNNDDWAGFTSRWIKKGFDGELWISASFNKNNRVTEVIFDKTPVITSSSWIKNVPKSICIYKNINDKKCTTINDKNKITKIVDFINNSIDWKGKVLPRKDTSAIAIGNLQIKILYERDKEIYLKSDKGTKIMKPDHEFFKLTNLTQ